MHGSRKRSVLLCTEFGCVVRMMVCMKLIREVSIIWLNNKKNGINDNMPQTKGQR